MKKKVLIAIGIIAIAALLYGYKIYHRIYGSNVTENAFLYIPTGTDYEGLLPVSYTHLRAHET